MPTIAKSRRDIYQTSQNGTPTYAQEVYIISDLPNDSTMGSEQVLAVARFLDPNFPKNNEPRYGLPLRYLRVDEVAESGKERRIVAVWGRRNPIFPDTTAQRFQMIGEETVIQPYAFTAVGGDPPATFFETRKRAVWRGRYRVLQGKLVSSGSDMQGWTILAASNINKLYRLNGDDGIPVLFKGIDYSILRQGGIWLWSIFEGTGWVRAQAANEIEPGSLPVAELTPLSEYRENPSFTAGTTVRPALKFGSNDGVYENGMPLPWL